MLRFLFAIFLTSLLWLGGANLPSFAESWINSNDIQVNTSDLLYKGQKQSKTRRPDIGVRVKGEKPNLKPAKPQKFVDPSDYNNKILEKIWKQFQEAGAFLDKKPR